MTAPACVFIDLSKLFSGALNPERPLVLRALDFNKIKTSFALSTHYDPVDDDRLRVRTIQSVSDAMAAIASWKALQYLEMNGQAKSPTYHRVMVRFERRGGSRTLRLGERPATYDRWANGWYSQAKEAGHAFAICRSLPLDTRSRRKMGLATVYEYIDEAGLTPRSTYVKDRVGEFRAAAPYADAAFFGDETMIRTKLTEENFIRILMAEVERRETLLQWVSNYNAVAAELATHGVKCLPVVVPYELPPPEAIRTTNIDVHLLGAGADRKARAPVLLAG